MLNAHTVARSLKDVPGMTTEILGNVIHKLTADGHLAVSGDALHAVAASGSDTLHQVSDTGFVRLQTPLEASADQKISRCFAKSRRWRADFKSASIRTK